MSFCGCAWKVFAVALCRACRSVIFRPMLLPRSLWTFGFLVAGPPRSAARTSTVRVSSGAFIRVRHEGGRTVLFACSAHLVDKNGMDPLGCSTQNVPVSLGVRLLMCKRVAFVCRRCIVHNRDRFVHARTLSDVGSSMAVGSLELLKLCSWFVSAEICHHATHDGLKWPLKDEIGNDQMMRNMWVIRLSCRSTTASLAENRERWIASRLVFCEWTFDGQLPCLDIDWR